MSAPDVFRGIGGGRALARLASGATAYLGALLVLWALGLVVRGALGWVLLLTPLITVLALSTLRWQRVCAELFDGRLRYEALHPRRDFEVDLGRLAAVYLDRTLDGRPLVVTLDCGDERVLGELGAQPARLLLERLRQEGVPAGDAPRPRAPISDRPSTRS